MGWAGKCLKTYNPSVITLGPKAQPQCWFCYSIENLVYSQNDSQLLSELCSPWELGRVT